MQVAGCNHSRYRYRGECTGVVLRGVTCRAAPTDQAYISRTQPSLSLDSASFSMCAVSLSQSGAICSAQAGRQAAAPQCPVGVSRLPSCTKML